VHSCSLTPSPASPAPDAPRSQTGGSEASTATLHIPTAPEAHGNPRKAELPNPAPDAPSSQAGESEASTATLHAPAPHPACPKCGFELPRLLPTGERPLPHCAHCGCPLPPPATSQDTDIPASVLPVSSVP
jgi:hypothetical protein